MSDREPHPDREGPFDWIIGLIVVALFYNGCVANQPKRDPLYGDYIEEHR